MEELADASEIKLPSNFISWKKLAELIKQSSTLKKLGLSCTGCSDAQLQSHLADALLLLNNNTIKELHLSGSEIGDSGASCLAEAIKHSDRSSHGTEKRTTRCKIYGKAQRISLLQSTE
jgi:hypothetical protein